MPRDTGCGGSAATYTTNRSHAGRLSWSNFLDCHQFEPVKVNRQAAMIAAASANVCGLFLEFPLSRVRPRIGAGRPNENPGSLMASSNGEFSRDIDSRRFARTLAFMRRARSTTTTQPSNLALPFAISQTEKENMSLNRISKGGFEAKMEILEENSMVKRVLKSFGLLVAFVVMAATFMMLFNGSGVAHKPCRVAWSPECSRAIRSRWRFCSGTQPT